MTLTCENGTTFTVEEGDEEVTITKSDQPECTIPLSDLRQFLRLYFDVYVERSKH